MTKKEFEAAYLSAQRQLPNITAKTMTELKKVYTEAGKLAAAAVRSAEMAGAAEITQQSLRAIELQLANGAALIVPAVDNATHDAVEKAADNFSQINEQYLFDVIDDAGDRVTRAGITNAFVRVNNRVVSSIVNRVFQDGYTFSERVWRVGQEYQESMKRFIAAAVAQGRDPVAIARDLSVYVQDGKQVAIKRWGNLRAGTSAFNARIRGTVDYNALRLVRSELYASIQDASKLAGLYNPASTQMYRWVRATQERFDCVCPENAAGSPYDYQDLPSFPHPNCLCRIVPILRDRREFVSDLRRWANFETVDYLDNWYRDYYL